jgi:hypothetical protein
MPRNTPQTPERTQFFIADKDATHLGPLEITADHRKNGVMLDAREAAYFLAAGTITPENPAKDAPARKVVDEASGEAHRAKHK